MIMLTPEAAAAVKGAMERAGKVDAGFRIMVETGGCAGHKYLVGLDAEPREDDSVFESGGVKVFVDPESHPLLAGMTVGFVQSLQGSGFVFENPNASNACSCGKSFG